MPTVTGPKRRGALAECTKTSRHGLAANVPCRRRFGGPTCQAALRCEGDNAPYEGNKLGKIDRYRDEVCRAKTWHRVRISQLDLRAKRFSPGDDPATKRGRMHREQSGPAPKTGRQDGIACCRCGTDRDCDALGGAKKVADEAGFKRSGALEDKPQYRAQEEVDRRDEKRDREEHGGELGLALGRTLHGGDRLFLTESRGARWRKRGWEPDEDKEDEDRDQAVEERPPPVQVHDTVEFGPGLGDSRGRPLVLHLSFIVAPAPAWWLALRIADGNQAGNDYARKEGCQERTR